MPQGRTEKQKEFLNPLMHFSCKPIFSPNLFILGQNDHFILIDPEIPIWASISSTGNEIVQLCKQNKNVYKVIEILAKKYSCSYDGIKKDVQGFLADLYRSGLLFSDSKGHRDLKKKKNNSRKLALKELHKTARAMVVSLMITRQCNLSCRHCYVPSTRLAEKELSFEEMTEIIDKTADYGIESVTLTGGEPLIRRDWQKIACYILDKGLAVSLATNGTLIDEECARFIYNHRIRTQISLDGSQKETHERIRGKGSYQAAHDGIDRLVKVGANKLLSLSVTPMRDNLYEISELIKLALDLDIPSIRFTRFNGSGRANSKRDRPNINEVLNLYDYLNKTAHYLSDRLRIVGCVEESISLHENGEPASQCPLAESLVIDPQGNVYPCAQFTHIKFSIGDIKRESFSEILSGRKLWNLRKLSLSRYMKIEKCHKCIWAHFCKGGCMAEAFAEHGTIYAPDPLCEARSLLHKHEFFKTNS